MLKTQKFTIIKILLTATLLFSNHLIQATTDATEIEDGSGLDNKISDPVVPNDDEQTLIGEIECSSNKDCGEGDEIHPWSYCTEDKFCACMEGRTSIKGGKCKCDKSAKSEGSCNVVINPEAKTKACKKLDCGDQGECKNVTSGAYCDCKNGYRGPMCGVQATGPEVPKSDPENTETDSPTNEHDVYLAVVKLFNHPWFVFVCSILVILFMSCLACLIVYCIRTCESIHLGDIMVRCLPCTCSLGKFMWRRKRRNPADDAPDVEADEGVDEEADEEVDEEADEEVDEEADEEGARNEDQIISGETQRNNDSEKIKNNSEGASLLTESTVYSSEDGDQVPNHVFGLRGPVHDAPNFQRNKTDILLRSKSLV